MLNFAVGPVMGDERILSIGAQQVPYMRTAEFSELMLENEKMVLELTKAPENSKCVFITGSGTASMEAVVMSVLRTDDKVLVVNGGSFGQRFVNLCKLHEIPFEEIKLPAGTPLTEEDLKPYENSGLTAFLINIHETSTGVLYDMEMVSSFCKRNNLLFIADSISSFLCDPFDMEKLGVDVMITGSQKALACPPGVSLIVLDEKAVKRVYENPVKCMYLDLKVALENQKRGQTPCTPAVQILIQIHERLRLIQEEGGIEAEIRHISALAEDFRKKIQDLPLKTASPAMSNACTPVTPLTPGVSAYDIFLTLKDEYDITVCPNGGDLRDRIFRVGHMGHLTTEDNDKLVSALKDMQKRGLL